MRLFTKHFFLFQFFKNLLHEFFQNLAFLRSRHATSFPISPNPSVAHLSLSLISHSLLSNSLSLVFVSVILHIKPPYHAKFPLESPSHNSSLVSTVFYFMFTFISPLKIPYITSRGGDNITLLRLFTGWFL